MNPAKTELLVRTKQTRPALAPKIRKLRQVSVELTTPESVERGVEKLLIFDVRGLDRKNRQELLRLLPGLVHVGRYWAARFAQKGCLCCRRKKVPYASGGLCGRCQAREYYAMREWYSKRFANRDLEKETEALCLRYNAAQRFFNRGDE